MSYVLSFVFIGIYWNNHHHLLHAVEKVNGKILWANMHLLFWISLIPFATAWMGENNFACWPVVIYGVVLLFAGFAYFLLTNSLLKHHDKNSKLAKSVGNTYKEKLSIILYSLGILMAMLHSSKIAYLLYIVVALMWLIPDKRFETTLHQNQKK
jgi:uncharacterized membrane protein